MEFPYQLLVLLEHFGQQSVFWHFREGPGRVGLILELVELCQLVHREMPLDLVFIDYSGRQRLLGYLPVVNLLLCSALCKESVDVHRLCLPKSK